MAKAELTDRDREEIEGLADRTKKIDRRTVIKVGTAALVAAPVLASSMVPRQALGMVGSGPRKKATTKKATTKKTTTKKTTRKKATRKKVASTKVGKKQLVQQQAANPPMSMRDRLASRRKVGNKQLAQQQASQPPESMAARLARRRNSTSS